MLNEEAEIKIVRDRTTYTLNLETLCAQCAKFNKPYFVEASVRTLGTEL
jgi:hypothetical protein